MHMFHFTCFEEGKKALFYSKNIPVLTVDHICCTNFASDLREKNKTILK